MGSVFQLKFKDYKIGEETDSSRCRLKKSCLKCKDNEIESNRVKKDTL